MYAALEDVDLLWWTIQIHPIITFCDQAIATLASCCPAKVESSSAEFYSMAEKTFKALDQQHALWMCKLPTTFDNLFSDFLIVHDSVVAHEHL
jgi:hypothetical protein